MKVRLLAVALLLTLLPLPGFAAPASDKITRLTLDNGMVVILKENHAMPWASVNVFIKSGGLWETPETNGISHFYEHLFFRGTNQRTGIEVKQQIEALGGETNAETSKDYTHFFVNVPSENISPVLSLMADALIHPSLDPKAIDVERNAVLDEMHMDADSVMGVLQDKLFALAYKTHPYRLSVIGTEANINRFKAPDFIAWKRRYYVPERTSLVVVGDFSTSQLLPQIRDLFGSFSSTGVSVPPIPDEVPIAETREVHEPAQVRAGFTLVGFRAPAVKARADVCAVDVMTFMLGQGDHNLLSTDLIDRKDVAQMVSLDYLTQRDDGLIVLSIAASAPRLPAATQEALRILQDVQDDKFTDADLVRAKATLAREYMVQNETDAGMAGTLGLYETIDHVDFATNYLDSVRKVTRQDVVRVARLYLGGPHLELISLPKGMMGASGTDANQPKPSTVVK